MAKAKFNIRPGIYTVPNIGRVDCTGYVKQDTALELYLNKHFTQFISLNAEGVSFLKDAKLKVKELSQLINRATTAEEVNLLLQVKSSDTIKRIAENKLKSLE